MATHPAPSCEFPGCFSRQWPSVSKKNAKQGVVRKDVEAAATLIVCAPYSSFRDTRRRKSAVEGYVFSLCYTLLCIKNHPSATREKKRAKKNECVADTEHHRKNCCILLKLVLATNFERSQSIPPTTPRPVHLQTILPKE